MDNNITKTCTKCGVTYSVTHFQRCSRNKDGLSHHCEECRHAYYLMRQEKVIQAVREYRAKNRDAILARNKLRYLRDRHKHAERGAKYREQRREQLREYATRYYQENRDVSLKKRRQYALENPDKITALNRRYYAENREQLKAYRRRYIRLHKDRVQETNRRCLLKHGHLYRAARHRRRARLRELPSTFTGEYWLLCLDYWHFTCAVCGSQLRDLFGEVEPHADHWIALTYKGADNPGTTPENMLCLCSTCNLSKNKKDPVIWLNERYPKHKAKKILKRITDYFEWIKQQ